MAIGKRTFNLARYRKIATQYRLRWKPADDELRGVCQRLGGHADRGRLGAKIMLINGAYQAGLLRLVPNAPDEKPTLDQIVDHISRNAKAVDRAVALVVTISEPLTAERLPVIADAHGELCAVIRGFNAEAGDSVSFVSKYLHFHSPAVPIYDARSSQALTDFNGARGKRVKSVVAAQSPRNEDYRSFLNRFWAARNRVIDEGLPEREFRVKEFDYWLWMPPRGAPK